VKSCLILMNWRRQTEAAATRTVLSSPSHHLLSP